MKKCPKCESEIEVIEYDPSVGIEGGEFCTNENCDWSEPIEDYDWRDNDI